jgi:hypothetical protein
MIIQGKIIKIKKKQAYTILSRRYLRFILSKNQKKKNKKNTN